MKIYHRIICLFLATALGSTKLIGNNRGTHPVENTRKNINIAAMPNIKAEASRQ